MDTSSENLDESMLDVIQRAEAFITAHSFLNREAERSSSNIFDVSGESFRTAPDEVSFANDSSINTSDEGPSNSDLTNHSSDMNISMLEQEQSDRDPDEVEVLSDDSQSTVPYDVNISPRVFPADNDDCIVIEVPDPVVNLCSPYVSSDSPRARRARRRRADAAPVVESITLDDTVAETSSQLNSRLSHSPPKKRQVAARTGDSNTSFDKSVSGSSVAAPSVACPICLESIFHQQAASTICGHLFCKECIYQEIQIRRKCPMCKRALKRHQVHPIYFN